MATTNISTEIVSLTGVSAHSASDEFIVSAQKFVVASIPKELMWPYATTKTDVGSAGYVLSGGSNVGDTILEVTYDGSKIASQVSTLMAYDVTDSASLHYVSTSRYPKFFIKNGTLFIKPDPSSNGTVSYVDFANLDDDSDLRNAVIYHACSKEFTKLTVFTSPTVGGTADELTDITALDAENTIDDFDGNSIEVDQWFATAAHFIEGEEDSELAQLQLSKISGYIQAYATELQNVNSKAAHYLKLAEKYYQLAQSEVQKYVQSNSKVMNKAFAMQSGQQQKTA